MPGSGRVRAGASALPPPLAPGPTPAYRPGRTPAGDANGNEGMRTRVPVMMGGLARCSTGPVFAPVLAFAFTLILAATAAAAQEPVPADTTHAPTPSPRPLDGEEAPTGPEVESVTFQGVESLDVDLLENAIATEATRCRSPLFFLFCALGFDFALEEHYLDRQELANDVERIELLYESWGFPDATAEARVEPEAGADEVDVTFTVREGEPIRVASIEIRGLNSIQPPVELPEPLPLEVGDLYALPLLDSLQNLILRAFSERGRPYARIEIGGSVNEAARTADLIIDIEPGPEVVFGETTILVEAPLDEEVVRERLAYEPGEPISLTAVEETQREIYALPIVERVVFEPVGLEEGATVVEPRITVETGRTSAVQVEGTVSSTDCLELAGFWRSRYFLGGPRLFSLGAGVGNLFAEQLGDFPCTGVEDDEGLTDDFTDLNYFVQADLQQPWPGHPHTTLLFSGYYVRETSPRVYVRRGYGGSAGIARQFRPDLTGAIQYSPSRNELSAADIFFCATYGACTGDELDDLTDLTWLSPVEAFVLWTPEGPPIQVRPPRAGERWRRWVRAGVEGAALFTGSEYEYFRTIDEAGATRILGERSELALHSRVGLLFGEEGLPPQVRLYSGGVNTVRGVPQNLLGPKVLVTAPGRLANLGCNLEPGGCPAGLVVDPDEVAVRPTGGELLFEANVETRRWLNDAIQMAAFADLGVLARDPWGRDDDALAPDNFSALITPGIGVRLLTGLGPIRIDLAYDPSGEQTIPLLTRDPDTGDLVILGDVVYDPYRWDDPDFFTELWRRLQLQVAIGQPF